MSPSEAALSTPPLVQHGLESVGYLADEGLATVVFLAMRLRRPLFLEGEPGAGKTELARALAALTGGELVRLQCYEGIDVSQAVYEWDYARQLLHLRAAEVLRGGEGSAGVEDELFSERFLVRRPLLRALSAPLGSARPVLLIDEIDRADDEFEAYLLELLADYAVTIPELGTITAEQPPIVVLTSNRTRDVHDALKRRSLYHWVEHPDFERELAILALRVPGAAPTLARQVTAAVQELRGLSLYKPPGVAETIDWAEALTALGRETLEEESLRATLGIVLKYREDQERAAGLAGELVARAAMR
ncbi:MAG TPA: MoxR family ATPase [Acidimicrobiales bacterium]|nr:MoxR family ATPase [Acidimicrobiales bacterium]